MAGGDLKITNFSKITLVKGYSKRVILSLTEDEVLTITNVKFVCSKLEICEDMTKVGNDYIFLITKEMTDTYDLIETTYNFNITYNTTPIEYGGFNSGILEVVANNNPNC